MSLTSEDLEDIKQLLDTSLSQQEKRLNQRIDKLEAHMDKQFSQIDERFERIDERFEEMDDKLNEIMNAVGGEFTEHTTRLDDHEVRITTLEAQTA